MLLLIIILTPLTQDAALELEGTSTINSEVQTKSFTVVTTPSVQTAAIPSWIRQGINYDANDATKIGLAIYAPGKVMFMSSVVLITGR